MWFTQFLLMRAIAAETAHMRSLSAQQRTLACVCASAYVWPTSSMSPPRRLTALILIAVVVGGMQMVAVQPCKQTHLGLIMEGFCFTFRCYSAC